MKKKKELTLRRRMIYTILLLLVVRLFSDIPVPFVNSMYFALLMQSNSSLNFFNTLSGNGLERLSVMTLSITPYISASIILELMGVVFPFLHEWRNGMDSDRKKYKKINLVMSVILAAVQALLMAIGFGRQGMIAPFKWYAVLVVTLVWTAGSAFAVFIGEYITDHYKTNGISLILMVNVLSSYISDLFSTIASLRGNKGVVRSIIVGIAVVLVAYLLHLIVAWIQTSEKRVPVMYHNKAVRESASASYLPIKLCPANVIPVIFTSTIMASVGMFASIGRKGVPFWARFFTTSYWFKPSQFYFTIGLIPYLLMIVGFSYYYIGIFMNPTEMAEDLKKKGGMINGIRPGKPTADYLRGITKYTVFLGAMVLCIVAVVPMIFSGVFSLPRISFMGTSLIIITGIMLETHESIKAERSAKKARKVGGFLSR